MFLFYLFILKCILNNRLQRDQRIRISRFSANPQDGVMVSSMFIFILILISRSINNVLYFNSKNIETQYKVFKK